MLRVCFCLGPGDEASGNEGPSPAFIRKLKIGHSRTAPAPAPSDNNPAVTSSGASIVTPKSSKSPKSTPSSDGEVVRGGRKFGRASIEMLQNFRRKVRTMDVVDIGTAETLYHRKFKEAFVAAPPPPPGTRSTPATGPGGAQQQPPGAQAGLVDFASAPGRLAQAAPSKVQGTDPPPKTIALVMPVTGSLSSEPKLTGPRTQQASVVSTSNLGDFLVATGPMPPATETGMTFGTADALDMQPGALPFSI